MRLKPDIALVKERLLAFWEREIVDRALIAVTAPIDPGKAISPFVNDIDFHGDAEALRDYWTNPATIRAVNLAKLENTFLGGESLPAIFQNYGTSGHCAYYGANPTYQQETIWFDPIWEEVDLSVIQFDAKRLEKHLETARYLVENAGGDYFVAMPDQCGTIDALGHLMGTENVMMAMMDQPEELERAVAKLNQGWATAVQAFYQASRDNCDGSVHAWMNLWAPGLVQQMQCDFSVMISPEMFGRFAVPELEQQIAHIDYPVYHFDGVEQVAHLDHILGLEKLRAIQWTHVAGQPSAAHYIPVLRRIQDAGKGLIIMAPPGDVAPLMEGLSHRGLYLSTEADTPEEAQALVRYVADHTRA